MLSIILKWVLPPLVLLVAASFLTTKTFRAETVIAASPEDIWAVLIDTASYPEWNPVFIEVSGAYETGQKVQNKVKDPTGKILEMTASVRNVIPNKELQQTGGITGFITYDHRWLLEPTEGGTKVIQHELDRGAFLWFWDSGWIEPAYASVNDALKDRVMSLAK